MCFIDHGLNVQLFFVLPFFRGPCNHSLLAPADEECVSVCVCVWQREWVIQDGVWSRSEEFPWGITEAAGLGVKGTTLNKVWFWSINNEWMNVMFIVCINVSALQITSCVFLWLKKQKPVETSLYFLVCGWHLLVLYQSEYQSGSLYLDRARNANQIFHSIQFPVTSQHLVILNHSAALF